MDVKGRKRRRRSNIYKNVYANNDSKWKEI